MLTVHGQHCEYSMAFSPRDLEVVGLALAHVGLVWSRRLGAFADVGSMTFKQEEKSRLDEFTPKITWALLLCFTLAGSRSRSVSGPQLREFVYRDKPSAHRMVTGAAHNSVLRQRAWAVKCRQNLENWDIWEGGRGQEMFPEDGLQVVLKQKDLVCVCMCRRLGEWRQNVMFEALLCPSSWFRKPALLLLLYL